MSNIWFALELVVANGSVALFVEQLRAAVHGRAWPKVRGFASPAPATSTPKRTPIKELEPLLGEVLERAKQPGSVTIAFAELSSLHWGQRPDGKTIFFAMSLAPAEKLFDDSAACVRALTHVARGLLAGGDVKTAAVDRFGDPGACVPSVPLAKSRRPLVLTSEAEVTAAYERPDDFWSAGWKVERFGDHKLLTRCQDVVEAGDVLREIQDHQWQMARAAKPKRTVYAGPTVQPDERPIYEEGDARIHPVGLETKTGTALYSCVLDPGQHVRGFEIYYLRSLIENKRMQDGTPVSNVRVVFQRQWMAESERRPLLDVGVEVFYRDFDTGELVQVTS